MHTTTIIKADQLLSTRTLETFEQLDQMPCLKRESCSSRSDPRRLRQSDWQQFWHEYVCPTPPSPSVVSPVIALREKHFEWRGVWVRSRWRTCSYIRLYANERVRSKLHNKRVGKTQQEKGRRRRR